MGAVDRALEIRVLEDHDRRLATEFQGDLGEVLGRVPQDVARGFGSAGEADPGHQRCEVRTRPQGSPWPVTMLTTPGGKPASSINRPNSSIAADACSDA